MTLAEAEVLALSTLKQVMEEKVRTEPRKRARARPRCSNSAAEHLTLRHALYWDAVHYHAAARLTEALWLLPHAPHLAPPTINCAQVTSTNVDIAKVAPTYHLYTTDEVEAVIARL